MRRLKVLVFAVCILSCKSSIPKDVLPPKKMQAVLWDVMQADETAEYYSSKDSSFHSAAKHAAYYDTVFSIHKITKQDFTRSLSYYENHPVTFKIILDSLQKYGERMQRADSSKRPFHPIGNDTTKKKLDTLQVK